MNKFMIGGLDRLGKDTPINGILNKRGYHQVLHFSKPVVLDAYTRMVDTLNEADQKREALKLYQNASFSAMFRLVRDSVWAPVICNRAHLGECVYAPLYRGYDGGYVFELERVFQLDQAFNLRLVLLTQDFDRMGEIEDDGESFDFTKRREEQELFIGAFERSIIADKRIVSVTAKTGGFKSRAQILQEVIN